MKESRDVKLSAWFRGDEASSVRMAAELRTRGNVSEFMRSAVLWMCDPDNWRYARFGDALVAKREKMMHESEEEVAYGV